MPEEQKKESPTISTLMKEKGKLMMQTQSPITTKQVLQIFHKTPAIHIHQRPGKGGRGDFDYVTGVYVKKVLNYVFGFLWDFQIIDKGREGDQVWVHGRLTIKRPKGLEPIIIKEQFGSADVKRKKSDDSVISIGDDYKAAATDALKKCASEIGIASDVYGKAEFKELQEKPIPTNKVGSFLTALTMVKNASDIDGLMKYADDVEESDKLTKGQKDKLATAIKERVDEIATS
ncbi:MAG TPA: hypothetical protein ENI13_00065 [candidate division CPR3 bacterium]|uniref:DNA repair protein Rad52 n=1 Tax=candidate division CPR3 bacterium TaxID=2268181 RepID=A0A7C1SUF3_UNCC3|nr:hypothetical protein [candidate division CPR3 bacterium]